MAHAFKSVYVPAFPKPRQKVKHIPSVKVMRDGREICAAGFDAVGQQGRLEYKSRVKAMWERQNGVCCLYRWLPQCPGRLLLRDATFEHENGRTGAIGRDDRVELPDGTWINGAAHSLCNGIKGSQKIPYNDARNEARRANSEQG